MYTHSTRTKASYGRISAIRWVWECLPSVKSSRRDWLMGGYGCSLQTVCRGIERQLLHIHLSNEHIYTSQYWPAALCTQVQFRKHGTNCCSFTGRTITEDEEGGGWWKRLLWAAMHIIQYGTLRLQRNFPKELLSSLSCRPLWMPTLKLALWSWRCNWRRYFGGKKAWTIISFSAFWPHIYIHTVLGGTSLLRTDRPS